MATKLRLQRHGKKGKPFYHLVVADSKSKRDGKIIEQLGIYNPNTNPATIEINFDKTVSWVNKGAEPTDTVRAILSYKGVMHYNHLMRGVAKCAFNEDEAKAKFEKWLEEKESKVNAKKDLLAKGKADDSKKRLSQEAEINAKKAEALAQKRRPVEVVEPSQEEVSEEVTEEVAEEAKSPEQAAE